MTRRTGATRVPRQWFPPTPEAVRGRGTRALNRPGGARGESGASLILALIFLLVVSVVIVSVANLAGNNLNNTSRFTGAQSFQSTANSADEVAIQYVRYNFIQASLNANPPTPCWTTLPTRSTITSAAGTSNPQSVSSWCSTQWTISTGTRVVTISTCLASVTLGSACAASPLLRTIVTIGDVDTTTGLKSCAPVKLTATTDLQSRSGTTCGWTLAVNSWTFNH